MAPFWRATLAAPDGWEFTGNLSSLSPDAMQYRVWLEQTADTGPLVDNRFTVEPNTPHLPVVYFWAVGGVARALGLHTLTAFTYAGSLGAAVLTLLVFVAVRRFTRTPRETWWVFGVALLGGGLGAYVKLIQRAESLHGIDFVQSWIVSPAAAYPPFEVYRGNYTFQALADGLSVVQWTLALGTLLLLHQAIRTGRRSAVVGAAAFGAIATLVHVYTGITIAGAAASAAVVLALRGHRSRGTWGPVATLLGCVGVTLILLRLSYGSGGLPMPTWTAIPLHPLVVVLAYPLVWPLLAWGLRRYAREAGRDRLFLLGWALGCVVLMLSAPLNPFPDRGAITAQIPLMLIAGGIWFDRVGKVGPVAALVVLGAVALAPLLNVYSRIDRAAFRPHRPAVFLSPDHQAVKSALGRAERESSVLLSEYPETLWLAPGYGAKHYCGHFFLTVDHERKQQLVSRFYDGDVAARAGVLREVPADLVWIPRRDRPEDMPPALHFTELVNNDAGVLFQRESVDER